MTAKEIVAQYQLLPHPEGGYYKEVFRSEGVIPQISLPHHPGDPKLFDFHLFSFIGSR